MFPAPTHRRIHLSKIVSHLSLAGAAVVLALGGTELVLRIAVPPTRGYSVLPPGASWTLIPAPAVLPGVAGVSHVRVNRLGVRGRLFGNDGAEYRILAVGGSTTICRALDDTEVWTHLLEVELGRTADGRRVWVGNVGRDGTSTRQHVLDLKYLLPQFPRIDVVVALVGANDMISALQQGWRYRSPAPLTDLEAEREEIPRAFAVVPGRLQDPVNTSRGPTPWYKATAVWQLGRRAKLALQARRTIRIGFAGTDPLELARAARAGAPKVDSLPSLEAALAEYRRNLNTMSDLAIAAGVHLVFVTQPSAWRDRMSVAEERELWLGSLPTDGATERAYFTTGALARAMARYNQALLDVCRQRDLTCLDAANLLPRDTTALYDDVHFNERGSRLLARALVAYFRQRSPFLLPT